MAPIKRPANQWRGHLKLARQSTRGALFIIFLILHIQQLALSLDAPPTNLTATQTMQLADAQQQAISESPVVTTTMDTLSGSLAEETPDADAGNVGAALAAAAAKRTTVKKELALTTEPTTSPDVVVDAATQGATQERPPQEQLANSLGTLLPGGLANGLNNRQANELVNLSPGMSSSVKELVEQLPNIYSQNASSSEDFESIQKLLPSNANLFDKDAIDVTQLNEMDCHLRNLDYCMAGLLGASQKILPETNRELETRCDEMRATTSCVAAYNQRCSTLKIFSALMPFIQQSSSMMSPNSNLLNERQKEFIDSAASGLVEQPAVSSIVTSGAVRGNQKSPTSAVSIKNLMELCEPSARNAPENTEVRQRLFQLSKCINSRIPKMSPCLEDLKTAFQVFYEPRRMLPIRPTCCALSRFRACSTEAIDGVCGLSSFEQLMQSFTNQAGPTGMIRAFDKMCRQATDPQKGYCKEVLPPRGMKTPQRRGSKASKLAKALDLISFAPATQEMGVF